MGPRSRDRLSRAEGLTGAFCAVLLTVGACGAASGPTPVGSPGVSGAPGPLATTHPTATAPTHPAGSLPAGSDAADPSAATCRLPPLRRQVAQLLLVAVPGTVPGEANLALVHEGVGGILLFGANIESARQVRDFIAGLQAEAEVPLIVAVDEEPGRIARVAGAGILPSTPTARELGDQPPERIRAVGRQIGAGIADLGFTVDLAPVLDVTGADASGVIGDRSFGSDPAIVSAAGVAFLDGLREGGVSAVAKHFPGHGESTVDSHTDLPLVTASIARLRSRALPPFAASIGDGVGAIMIGHLLVRSIDPERPASLSEVVIGGLLRGELGFDGLVVSDALEMGALEQFGDLPVVAELAIAAGTDLAILSGSTQTSGVIDGLVEAVDEGRLPASRVREAFLRVARFKGIHDWDACGE